MDDEALKSFARESSFPEIHKILFDSNKIRIEDDFIVFNEEAVNSYTVAILADYFRGEFLAHGMSFSSETVFSHPSKIDLLKNAHHKGFRTYLYFVATESPEINISRVSSRVGEGGHNVPIDKIVERYQRCLDNVSYALPFLDRGYFFDNSGTGFHFIAEIENGEWTLFSSSLPQWFIESIYRK